MVLRLPPWRIRIYIFLEKKILNLGNKMLEIGTKIVYEDPRLGPVGHISGEIFGYYDDDSVFIRTPAGHEWIVKINRITIDEAHDGNREPS